MTAPLALRRSLLLAFVSAGVCAGLTFVSSQTRSLVVERNSQDELLAKVTLMLQEMKAKSQTLQNELVTMHTEVRQKCAQGSAQAASDIGVYRGNVESLSAYIQALEAAISQSEIDVREYQIDIERYTQDLALAKEEKVELDGNFTRDLAAYDEAIAAAERAKLILQAQMPSARPESALLEVSSLVASAHGAIAAVSSSGGAGAGFLSHRYSPDGGGMSRDEHIFDDFEGVTSATDSYSTEMGSVDGVVADVLQIFKAYRTQLLETKDLTMSDYEGMVTQLQQQVTTSRNSLNLAVQDLADQKTSLVTKQQDLADQEESVTTTASYKEKLDAACAEKEKDFEEMNTMRANEIAALDRAVLTLQGSTASGGTGLRLLRLRSSASSELGAIASPSGPGGVEAAGEEEKVLGFLRLQARKLSSGSIDRLTGQLEALVSQESSASTDTADPVRDDAMAKVKGMIQELITKLQTQAAAEATHHAWCQSEIAKNEQAKETAQSDIKKHAAQVAQLGAALEKLGLEIEQINATLLRGETDRASLVSQRKASKIENEAAIEDAESSAQTVDAALALLQEYFTKASKTAAFIDKRRSAAIPSAAAVVKPGLSAPVVKPASKPGLALLRHGKAKSTRQDPDPEPAVPVDPDSVAQQDYGTPMVAEGQGVMAMLEVVRDGYSTLATKTRDKEQAAEREHVQALQDHDVMIAAATKDQEYKLEQERQYTSALEDSHTDLDASSQALVDAETTYEQLKPPCVTGETWEEKMAKRNDEIAALEEAYQMLQEFSAELGFTGLLQTRRRALLLSAPADASGRSAPTANASSAGANSSALASAAATATSAPPAEAAAAAPPATPTAAPPLPPPAQHRTLLAAAGAAALSSRRAAANATHGQSPVEDVSALLASVKEEVETELADDTRVYEETSQWCTETIAESQAAIQAADERDSELMTLMETSTQGKAQGEVQIARLKDELQKEQRSLEQSQALREKEAAHFHENEKELLESISALSHALVVLNDKYNSTETRDYAGEREQIEQERQQIYADADATSLVRITGTISHALRSLPSEEANVINTLEDNGLLQQFLSSPQDILFGIDTSAGSHKMSTLALRAAIRDGPSASGKEIFGILRQLLETFKGDLAAAQTRESTDQETFRSLQETKSAQIQALIESISLKEEQLAHDSVDKAQASEDLTYVRESRKAEVEHLMNVQAECRDAENEFLTRKTTRNNEIASLSEAIAILNSNADVEAASSIIDSGGSGEVTVSRFHEVTHAQAGHLATLPNASLPIFPLLSAAPAAAKPKPNPQSIFDAFLKSHSDLSKPHSPRAQPSLATSSRKVAGGNASASAAAAARRVLVAAAAAPGARTSAQARSQASAGASGLEIVLRTLEKKRSLGTGRPSLLSLALHSKGKQTPSSEVRNNVLGALDQIGSVLDKVRDTLIAEKAREVELQQTCIKEKHEAELQLSRREHDLMTFTATQQRLEGTVSGTQTNVKDLEEQIKQLNSSITAAETARTDQYENFKTSIDEQEQLQAKLHQAIAALKAFYGGSAPPPSLLQVSSSALGSSSKRLVQTETTTAPAAREKPAGFKRPLQSHGGSRGIISILELLIEESEQLVTSIARSEGNARDAHGVNIADTRRSIDENSKQITMLQATGTNADVDLEETKAKIQAVQLEISEIHTYVGIVDKNCNYVVNNFESSQAARQAQIDNIRHAKEVFQGLAVEG